MTEGSELEERARLSNLNNREKKTEGNLQSLRVPWDNIKRSHEVSVGPQGEKKERLGHTQVQLFGTLM